MTHRDITLTDDERTAALLVYLFACLAFACRTPAPESDEDESGDRPWFYGWVTSRRGVLNGREDRTFGDAVMWAMRGEGDPLPGDDSAANPEAWLSYVEHVVGYRTGPGNGHSPRST